jgi:hypothetical protein
MHYQPPFHDMLKTTCKVIGIGYQSHAWRLDACIINPLPFTHVDYAGDEVCAGRVFESSVLEPLLDDVDVDDFLDELRLGTSL